MGLLLGSRFFSREKVEAGGVEISPKVAWVVPGKKLSHGNPRDLAIFRVITKSRKGEAVCCMVDMYDEKQGATSTVGSNVERLLSELDQRGVVIAKSRT